MLLSAVSDAVLASPALAEPLAAGPRPGLLDLTAPRGAAAVRGRRAGPGRAHGAAGDRDRPRGRGAHRRARAPWSTPRRVAYYPSWETLPHERLSPRSDTVGRRLAVLRRLRHPGADGRRGATGPLRVVVAPVRSILQPQVKGLGDLEPVELAPGDTVALDDVVRRLADAAYTRVDLVEKRGEFAVRGGIVDVFPPTEEHPLRVEFWGDEVDEIRSFAVADQRTIEPMSRLWAPPCRELLLTDDVRRRAAELGEAHPQLAEMTDQDRRRHRRRGHGVAGAGAGRRARAARRRDARRRPRSLVVDPERVRSRAHDLVATSEEFLGASLGGRGRRRHRADRPRRRVVPRARRRPRPRPRARDAVVDGQPVRARRRAGDARPAARAPRSTATAATSSAPSPTCAAGCADGYRVVVVHPGHGPAQRMVEVLGEHDVAARLVEPGDDGPLESGLVTVTTGTLAHGFVDDALGLVLLTGDDLSGPAGRHPRQRRMPARRKRQIDPLELKAGDYVVHEQHGVGRFVEMRQREVQGATREYLVLEYGASKRGGPPDRLFVPADSLDQVTRYVGGEQPSLDRLGGADWAKRKGRARKAVREIAAELIKLYAARQATQGYAFGPDTPWQRELEDAFPFHETPDQLTTVEEVKADMRADRPDGPAGLRRRRLRQDRDRGAGGVQGGAGRQAGRGARADDAAGAAALLDVRRADGRASR